MTDKEKLSEVVRLAYGMYYAALYTATDTPRLHRAMDSYRQFIITEYNKQEPASEDFESEWKRYCDSKGGGAVTMNVKDVAKHFAQWQREQIMKNAIDATVTGVREYREENEVDFTIMLDKGIVPYVSEEDVKLIIIKE